MKLKDYLSQGRGRQASLANAIGVHEPDISRWAKGSRPIPIRHASAIEQATESLVTRKDMFPDDWQLIWPELAPTPDTQ